MRGSGTELDTSICFIYHYCITDFLALQLTDVSTALFGIPVHTHDTHPLYNDIRRFEVTVPITAFKEVDPRAMIPEDRYTRNGFSASQSLCVGRSSQSNFARICSPLPWISSRFLYPAKPSVMSNSARTPLTTASTPSWPAIASP